MERRHTRSARLDEEELARLDELMQYYTARLPIKPTASDILRIALDTLWASYEKNKRDRLRDR